MSWFFNDNPITSVDEVKIATESDVHMHRTLLEIKNVREKHSGIYKLKISNDVGEAECVADVKIKG